MWVWRDETTTTTPGWRLDAAGTWTWDEPSLLERSGVGVGALRHGFAPEPARATARALPAEVPAARRPEPALAATPIFQALTADHTRRSTLHAVRDERDERPAVPAIPEPHPGSGPLPIQDANGPVRRGLADVPTVPPPPAPGGQDAAPESPESPEDELRRRAERRRRPREEPVATGGRHAMRGGAGEPATGGRHAMR